MRPEETRQVIEKIRIDGDTQPPLRLSEQTVTEYAEAISGGAKFPPIVVFHDGTDYWLASGFHRLLAMRSLRKTRVGAEVRKGTARDARLYAAATNDTHGLRRAQGDLERGTCTLIVEDLFSMIDKVLKVKAQQRNG